MKRAVATFLFAGLGLICSWASLRLVALINWSKLVNPRPHGCWEIDHCDVPWYIGAWLVFELLLPTGAFAVVGWRLGKEEADARSLVLAILALSGGTFVFYAAGRAAGGY